MPARAAALGEPAPPRTALWPLAASIDTAHRSPLCPASLAARDLPLRTNYRGPASEITTHGAADYPTEAMVRTGALLKPLRGAHGAFCGENRSKSYVEGRSYHESDS